MKKKTGNIYKISTSPYQQYPLKYSGFVLYLGKNKYLNGTQIIELSDDQFYNNLRSV